jgi:hypothetical protein
MAVVVFADRASVVSRPNLMPATRDHDPASWPPAWAGRALVLVMGGVAAALLVAVVTTVITVLASAGGTPNAQASTQASLAARRAAANRQWASAACSSLLDWRDEIHHDDSSLDLGFGPAARVRAAIAATTRMLDRLDALGLPPSAQTPEGRAGAAALRADLTSPLRALEADAGSVAGGNLAAIGSLIGDLRNEGAAGTRVVTELRHVASVELGLSLAETRACRQLVGIPV